jgi:hypothetical protein
MKPCRPFKKRIALSIVERQNDAEVEQHLAHCAACRAYAEEIHAVCADHTNRVADLPDHDAPVWLHGKVRAALDGSRRRWSWAHPVAAGALAALVMVLYLHRRPSPKPTAAVTVAVPRPQVLEPSYAAYRHHLSRSAEELEAALSRDDTGVGAAAEVFTVSTRAAALP